MSTKLFLSDDPELAAWADAQLTPEMRELLPLLPAHKRPYVEWVDKECPEHGPYRAKHFGYGKYVDESATEAAVSGTTSNTSSGVDAQVQADAAESKARYDASREQGDIGTFKKPTWGTRAMSKGVTTKCPTCQAIKQGVRSGKVVPAHEQAPAPVLAARRLHEANIPMRYRDKTIAGFDSGLQDNPTSGRSQRSQAVKNVCLDYIRDFANNGTGSLATGRSLVILGQSGVGKTHLACAITQGAVKQGFHASYTLMSDVTRSITDSWKQGKGGKAHTEAAIYEQYQAPDLLVIDDVTTVGLTQMNNRIFSEIIDKRYCNMKPTIIVSNRGEQELKHAFGETALSFADVVNFERSLQ